MQERTPFSRRHPVWFSVVMMALFVGLTIVLSLVFSPFSHFADGSGPYYVIRIARRLIAAAVFVMIARKIKIALPASRLRFDWVVLLASLCLLTINLSVPTLFDARSWLYAVQNPLKTLLLLLDCLMIGGLEEIVFRGVIFGALQRAWESKRRGLLSAVVVSSLLFGLVHIANLIENPDALLEVLGQVGYSTLIGLLLALAALRTGGITFSIVLHGLFNFVYDYAQMLPFSSSSAWYGETAEAITLAIAYGCLAVTGICMLTRELKAKDGISVSS